MTIDPRAFRQTMSRFATGVTVVAAQHGGEIHAMTANALASLSLDPAYVVFCVSKQAKMAGFLEKSAGFSINFLRGDQQALSTYFAGGWTEPTSPPFRFVPWAGRPRLEGCLAALGCIVQEFVEGGDHWIVMGQVVALHQGIEPHRPLLFFGGRYWQIDTTESTPAPDVGWVEVPTHVYYDPWQSET